MAKERGARSVCRRSRLSRFGCVLGGGGGGIDRKVPYTPRRLEHRGGLAEIDDDLLPENYRLPAGQRYQPVDGPLAHRGCFMLPWKCKCSLRGENFFLVPLMLTFSLFPSFSI